MDRQNITRAVALVMFVFGLANLLAIASVTKYPSVFGMTLGEAAVPLGLSAILFLLAGIGIWQRKIWGKILATILLVISLIGVIISLASDMKASSSWIFADAFVIIVDGILLWLMWGIQDEKQQSTKVEIAKKKTKRKTNRRL